MLLFLLLMDRTPVLECFSVFRIIGLDMVLVFGKKFFTTSVVFVFVSIIGGNGRCFAKNQDPNTLEGISSTNDTTSTRQDTVDLASVQVWAANWRKFAVGQSVQTFDQRDIEDFQGLGLAEFLQARTALFLRQNGPGMLASLTMRGTSAGHNAVFWNGLPINSPSLGQSDFSILPVGGFEEFQVHHGGGAALFGTDAIGGSVHMTTKLRFDQGHRIALNTLAGSFGRWNQSGEYYYSNKRTASRFRAFRNFAQNNFPYRDLSKPGTPIAYQNHTQVAQWGFLQDFAWNIKENQQLSSSFWWNDTDRQIQPVIGSNTSDVQLDKNIRWALDYFRFWHGATLNIKSGWVRDDQTFNVSSRNLTDQILTSADIDWSLASKWVFKSGLRHTRIVGNLSTYFVQEDRTELYQASRYQPNENFSLSLNLRQLQYDGSWAPFTPSFGMEWEFWKAERHSLRGKSSLSRAFKVPTLNDRFWVPGGNPDILPEDSWSAEVALEHVFKKKGTKLTHGITRYRMYVDNWIIWLPKGSIWSPDNIRAVQNDGVEYQVQMGQSLAGDWKLDLAANYAWTRAIQTAAATEGDTGLGMQLPYTPLHKIQGMASLGKGKTKAFANSQWVAERFVTTDNLSSVPPYYLLDVGTQYRWRIDSISGLLGFQINNLLDTEYQIMRLRAMPGRNYQINLSISL